MSQSRHGKEGAVTWRVPPSRLPLMSIGGGGWGVDASVFFTLLPFPTRVNRSGPTGHPGGSAPYLSGCTSFKYRLWEFLNSTALHPAHNIHNMANNFGDFVTSDDEDQQDIEDEASHIRNLIQLYKGLENWFTDKSRQEGLRMKHCNHTRVLYTSRLNIYNSIICHLRLVKEKYREKLREM